MKKSLFTRGYKNKLKKEVKDMEGMVKVDNQKKESFTSLELVELINKFREQEGNKNPLLHKNFMAVIKDEFEEEIHELKIQPMFQTVEIANGAKRKSPYFVLDLQQARQVLVRESKFVRKAVIKYIDELEKELDKKLSKKDQLLLNIINANSEEERSTALGIYQAEYVKPLENENVVQKQRLLEYEPKVTYYDTVLQSDGVIPITVIAKDYGMSGQSMNQLLHENGVQYKMSGVWLLYSQHQDKGYTKTKTSNFVRSDGTEGMAVHTYWTQKGRLFIYETLKRADVLPLIEREG